MEACQGLTAASAMDYTVSVIPHLPQDFIDLDGQTDRPGLARSAGLTNGPEVTSLNSQDPFGKTSIEEILPANKGLFVDRQANVRGTREGGRQLLACPALKVENQLRGQSGLGLFLGQPVSELLEGFVQALAGSVIGALYNMDCLFIFCIAKGTAIVALVGPACQNPANSTLAGHVFEEPTLLPHR